MQTILGGGGAIGIPLAKELRHYTSRVRIVSRTPQKVSEADELFAANLLNKDETFKAVEGSDIAYLTIGLPYSSAIWQSQWPVIMANVTEACTYHGTKLVFLDNVYMYDSQFLGDMTEDIPVNPQSKKGKVRAAIAASLLEKIKSGALKAIIARSADFYGPGVENSIITQAVVRPLLAGKPALWIGTTSRVHNFTFVYDAAKALAFLGNTEEAYNQIWHLPTDKTLLTGSDWIELFARELGVKARQRCIPVWMLRLLGIFNPMMKEMADVAYQMEGSYFFDSKKFDKQYFFPTTNVEYAIMQIADAEKKLGNSQK